MPNVHLGGGPRERLQLRPAPVGVLYVAIAHLCGGSCVCVVVVCVDPHHIILPTYIVRPSIYPSTPQTA